MQVTRPNRLTLLLLTAGLALCHAPSASGAPIAWTYWNTATVGDPSTGRADGVVAVGPAVVQVTYAGELTSNTRVNMGPTPAGFPSWGPASSFSGGAVANPPTYGQIIALLGGTPATDTITFSTPVVDPILAIWSLGRLQPTETAEFTFPANEPFTIESGGPSTELTGTTIYTVPGTNTVYGAESGGTIRFAGTYSQLSWTNPIREDWYGFTVGITNVVPEPASPLLAVVATAGYLLLRRSQWGARANGARKNLGRRDG